MYDPEPGEAVAKGRIPTVNVFPRRTKCGPPASGGVGLPVRQRSLAGYGWSKGAFPTIPRVLTTRQNLSYKSGPAFPSFTGPWSEQRPCRVRGCAMTGFSLPALRRPSQLVRRSREAADAGWPLPQHRLVPGSPGKRRQHDAVTRGSGSIRDTPPSRGGSLDAAAKEPGQSPRAEEPKAG
jgi:hypothetical protein